MLLESFLRAILPTEGVKCWVEISKNKDVTQGFTASIEELALKLQEIDARGSDAYFACSTFKNGQNRRAGNVLGVKAFWLDIDAGKGKPYATFDEAVAACDEFCNGLSLPIPGVVRSGSGAHVYWPLDRMLTSDEWCTLAKRLKLLANSRNFHTDPARTADIASILRPPGTKNYKIPDNPRPVEVEDADLFEGIDTNEFIRLLLGDTAAQPANNFIPVGSRGDAVFNSNLSAGLSQAFDASKGIGEGGGRYGGRNNACAAYAGELVAKGHPQEEVLRACLEWNKLNTPPLPDKEVETTVSSIIRRDAEKHPAPVIEETLPEIPFGFRWTPKKELQGKVIERMDDGSEKEAWKTITHLPIFLTSLLNEEGFKTKNSYLFTHYHPTKGRQQFALGAKDFNSAEWYGTFVEHGCSVIDGMDKLFKTYIRRMENMLRAPGNEQIRYNQFGWKENDQAFLVGENLCHADGRVTRAVGTERLTPLMKVMMPSAQGSLQDWTRAANKLFTPGVETHGAMLLAGFAAPLMKFCVDEGNGGSILSIISEDSGHGKTPMATAIASIWGKAESTVTTGNFTENRRIEELVRHCHLPQVQEEMAYSDPQVAALGIEKFTSGTDRGRLTQAGNASGIPERYQTVLISISNKSLYQLVQMVSDPMSRRIFEIETERPPEEVLSNIGGISREMMRNCGHAGLQFSRLIVNPAIRAYIKKQLSGEGAKVGELQLYYRRALNSSPEHRFIVWLLASMELAAEILNRYGILNFDLRRVMDWIQQQASLQIDNSPAHQHTNKLNKFLIEHSNSCVTVHDEFTPKNLQMPSRLPIGPLYMRMEQKPGRLYIATDPLQRWCTKNSVSFRALAKSLLAEGVLLEKGKLITLGAGTGIPSMRTLCWVVDMNHPLVNGQIRLELSNEVSPDTKKVPG